MVNFTPVQVQIQFGQVPPKFRRLYCTNKKNGLPNSINHVLAVSDRKLAQAQGPVTRWQTSVSFSSEWPGQAHTLLKQASKSQCFIGGWLFRAVKAFGSEHLQRKLASWVPSAFQKQSSQNLKQEQFLISVSVFQTQCMCQCVDVLFQQGGGSVLGRSLEHLGSSLRTWAVSGLEHLSKQEAYCPASLTSRKDFKIA